MMNEAEVPDADLEEFQNPAYLAGDEDDRLHVTEVGVGKLSYLTETVHTCTGFAERIGSIQVRSSFRPDLHLMPLVACNVASDSKNWPRSDSTSHPVRSRSQLDVSF